MNFNLLTLFIPIAILFLLGFSIVKVFFKSRKRSPESIYKLIDDLEKRYIY